jgi:hypothetical protein
MTADDNITAIRRKVDRAKQHLRDLQSEVTAFLDSTPYEVGVKRDPETRKPIYFVTRVATTPVKLPLIAGDVLQNLRSALDHLAYKLEVIGLGSDPPDPRYIAYPICDAEAEYLAVRHGRIKSARSDAKSAIDATKPYRGGNDTLWRLHKLNIIDKHRLLLTVGSAFRAVDVGAEMRRMMREAFPDMPALPPVKAFIKPADRLFPLKVGDELYIGGVDHPVNAEMQFSFDLALGEPGIVDGEPLLETLLRATEAVDNLVTEFKPHLA